jgi:lysyl endopeptidase
MPNSARVAVDALWGMNTANVSKVPAAARARVLGCAIAAAALCLPGASAAARAELRMGPAAAPAAKAQVEYSSITEGGGAPMAVGFARVAGAAEGAAAVAAIEWRESAGRWKGELRIAVEGAAGLRVGFRNLPDDASMRFLDASGRVEATLPAGQAMLAIQRGETFWGPATDSGIQLIEFTTAKKPASGAIALQGVSQLTSPPSRGFTGLEKSAGACQEDVACIAQPSPEFARAARSVAKLLYTVDGASYVCTGTLVASPLSGNASAFLLTAKHCIDSMAAARTLNTFWSFEARTCNSAEAAPYVRLSRGARLVHAGAGDLVLLQLAEPAPAGAEPTELAATPLSRDDPIIALHHPQGAPKKVAAGMVVDADAGGASGLASVGWINGSTEPGSSGSGLLVLRGSKYVLHGVLRGGSSSCTTTGRMSDPSNRDYYTRTDPDRAAIMKVLTAAALPDEDFTDMWQAADDSGRGLSVVQHPSGNIFAVWFTYDEAGAPTWLVIPGGSWTSSHRFTGKIYRANRGRGSLQVDALGEASIEFDATTARLETTIAGVGKSTDLRRQDY